ncbi:uncharacterized protein [Lolium perenne]|uniref:uncharacterized protein n=1 Tax=Lolium perenne TaxID=4522 RepID=UPI0021F5B7B3|nr:uncharacterized protein LOC127308507 [Lolium perenne]
MATRRGARTPETGSRWEDKRLAAERLRRTSEAEAGKPRSGSRVWGGSQSHLKVGGGGAEPSHLGTLEPPNRPSTARATWRASNGSDPGAPAEPGLTAPWAGPILNWAVEAATLPWADPAGPTVPSTPASKGGANPSGGGVPPASGRPTADGSSRTCSPTRIRPDPEPSRPTSERPLPTGAKPGSGGKWDGDESGGGSAGEMLLSLEEPLTSTSGGPSTRSGQNLPRFDGARGSGRASTSSGSQLSPSESSWAEPSASATAAARWEKRFPLLPGETQGGGRRGGGRRSGRTSSQSPPESPESQRAVRHIFLSFRNRSTDCRTMAWSFPRSSCYLLLINEILYLTFQIQGVSRPNAQICGQFC